MQIGRREPMLQITNNIEIHSANGVRPCLLHQRTQWSGRHLQHLSLTRPVLVGSFGGRSPLIAPDIGPQEQGNELL